MLGVDRLTETTRRHLCAALRWLLTVVQMKGFDEPRRRVNLEATHSVTSLSRDMTSRLQQRRPASICC